VTGVVVVDKPRGVTSFDVVAECRRRFHERRVGHTGTLDPMATGVLPVCLGEATKLVPFLTAAHKAYEAEALLGVATDTLDAEGTIVRETPAGHLTREDVERALACFVGRIQQRPPMHSAIRVGGKRLYELAREGQEIERAAREVEVRSLALQSFEPEGARVRIRFSVACGKGTYIRSIAGDLGDRLGVGAHLTMLRRTAVGPFSVDRAVQLEHVAGAPVLGLAEALAHLPTLPVAEAQVRDVRDGKVKAIERLPVPSGLSAEHPFARLLRPDGSLLAVAEQAGASLRLLRVFTLTSGVNS
jgi:tRNA pseudouridine55 synthase